MPDWICGRDRWRVYPGDFREIIGSIADDAYDCIITDPPYAEETHEGAITGVHTETPEQLVDFESITEEELRQHYELLARVCKRWLVGTMDWRHIAAFEKRPPRGWRFVRFGIWLKPNPTPQLSGDRPGTGWEGICALHRDRPKGERRMKWNGGGKAMNYIHPRPHSQIYRTQKPVGLIRDIIRDFVERGATIFDPYGGSGTTGVAGLLERCAVDLCERREEARDKMIPRLNNVQAEGTEAVPLMAQGRFW
jgi:site-specific DNA-methyltransferase (adenine-specific)